MHVNMKRAFAIVGGVIATIALAGLATAQEEVEVSLDQVPKVVQETILREAAGAKITEIEQETKDGKTMYEAEFERDGRTMELKIAPDGRLLGRKFENEDDDDDDGLTVDQLPAPARTALLKLAGGAKIVEVERETEHGATIFEAAWSANGTKHEAAVTSDGTLVETEEVIPVDQAPSAVRAAIAKHFGAETTVVVERKTIILYEAEAKIDGKESELLIFPTGQIHEDKHDDDDHHGDDNGDDGDDDRDDDD